MNPKLRCIFTDPYFTNLALSAQNFRSSFCMNQFSKSVPLLSGLEVDDLKNNRSL